MMECLSNNLAMVMVTGNYINPSLPYHCQADGVQQYKEKNELKKMTLKQKNYCKILC